MSVEILKRIRKAVREYNADEGAIWAGKAIDEGIDPAKCLDVLTESVREIGDGYSRGEFFLPDLIGAANVMKNTIPILEKEFKKTGKKRKAKGVIVAGTVFGDIHSIGISMVAALARAEGFNVIELGVNIKAEEFVKGVRNYKPHILAISALMTTTAPEQKKVIEFLKKEGLRDKVKIAVGGGAITQDFAEEIGADGYKPTAPMSVDLFIELVGIK